MMHRLKLLSTTLRASFWFIPYLIVCAFVALALFLTRLRVTMADEWLSAFPVLFSVSAAGAREMLSAIAASMISVAGLVFSMTLVALALASTQYSSRVLRTFMRSRLTQVSIGVFAGLYTYCLIVLRAVKGEGDDLVLPLSAVSLALLFAIGAVALLIFFIHHIALSIQASTILASVARETIATIEGTFPHSSSNTDVLACEPGHTAVVKWGPSVLASGSGYLQSIDEAALLELACKHDTVIRMERGVGQFVIQGTALMTLVHGSADSQELSNQLRKLVKISVYRTIEQDPSFGVRQIVDVALKALSPGINDTTTAVMCIDYLGTILALLAPKNFPPLGLCAAGRTEDKKVVKVLTIRPDFAALVSEAFDQIRRAASGNVAIIDRMSATIEVIGRLTAAPERIRVLAAQLDLLDELSAQTVVSPAESVAVRSRIAALRSTLTHRSPAHSALKVTD